MLKGFFLLRHPSKLEVEEALNPDGEKAIEFTTDIMPDTVSTPVLSNTSETDTTSIETNPGIFLYGLPDILANGELFVIRDKEAETISTFIGISYFESNREIGDILLYQYGETGRMDLQTKIAEYVGKENFGVLRST